MMMDNGTISEVIIIKEDVRDNIVNDFVFIMLVSYG